MRRGIGFLVDENVDDVGGVGGVGGLLPRAGVSHLQRVLLQKEDDTEKDASRSESNEGGLRRRPDHRVLNNPLLFDPRRYFDGSEQAMEHAVGLSTRNTFFKEIL